MSSYVALHLKKQIRAVLSIFSFWFTGMNLM